MKCPHEFVAGDDYYPCLAQHHKLPEWHKHCHGQDDFVLMWRSGSVFDHVDTDEPDPPMPPVTTRHGVTT